MKEQNLKNIRKKYKEFIKQKEKYKSLIEKKEELEKKPDVKEYINLLEIIDSWDSNVQEKSDKQLLDKAVYSERIVESNNIFVYMGTYRISSEIDIVHGSSDNLVAKNDPSADYRIYSDIEKNSLDASIQVPISQCDKFEKENFVLYPNRRYVTSEYYNLVREIFFETAVKSGQKKAIEKVISMFK